MHVVVFVYGSAQSVGLTLSVSSDWLFNVYYTVNTSTACQEFWVYRKSSDSSTDLCFFLFYSLPNVNLRFCLYVGINL